MLNAMMLTTLIKYRENAQSPELKLVIAEVMDRTGCFLRLVDNHPGFQAVLN